MTKKLEEVFNLPSDKKEKVISPEEVATPPTLNLQEKLEEFDKISAALPKVKGLGDVSDSELDALATKAEQAYDDLMDLGMQVEPRYSARMFEVAGNFLNSAVAAKSAKIDKKLKMVELQIKKYGLDKKNGDATGATVEAQGVLITDRNSLLEKLKNMDK
jgi:hypothetical protein